MGKTAKGKRKINEEPVQQPKISNFFQTGPVKAKEPVLFTELGKSSSSNKLTLKKPVVVCTAGKNQHDQHSDTERSKVKTVNRKTDQSVESNFHVNRKTDQSAESNFRVCEDQDVIVIPETQMLFSPSPRRDPPGMAAASKLNTSYDILIPDTPDDNQSKADQRKKLFCRSFLTGSSNISKPAGLVPRVKPNKSMKPALSKAKKILLSVSVDFNPKTPDKNVSENSSDKIEESEFEVEDDKEDPDFSEREAELVDIYLEQQQQQKCETNIAGSFIMSEVMKEARVVKCVEEQTKRDNSEQCIEEDISNENKTENGFAKKEDSNPSKTPVKIYDSDIPSIKRMSKAGLSPDPKRNMSGKTKFEMFEKLMEEGNGKEYVSLDRTGSNNEKEKVKKKLQLFGGSTSEFVSSKKLMDKAGSEIGKKTGIRSKGDNSRSISSTKKMCDKVKGSTHLSQQLGYQMGLSRSKKKSQSKNTTEGVKSDDVLGEILQELETTPTQKLSKSEKKSPVFTKSTMNGVDLLADVPTCVKGESYDSLKQLPDSADSASRRSGGRDVVRRLDRDHELQSVDGWSRELASQPKQHKQHKSVGPSCRSLSADISFTEEELAYFDDLDSGVHTCVGEGADSKDNGTIPHNAGQSALFTPIIPKLKKSSSHFAKTKSKEIIKTTLEKSLSDEIMEDDVGLELMMQCLTPEPKRCASTSELLTPSIQRCVTPDPTNIRATQNINEFPSQVSSKHTGERDVEMEIEELPTQSVSQELCEEFDQLTPFKDKAGTEIDHSEVQPPCVHFGRHTVKNVDRTRDSVTLELEDYAEKIARTCILEGFWYDTHITEGDTVHVIGQFDDHMTCCITDKSGLIVVNPDRLLSGTSVVSGVFCMRKSILNEKFKGCDRGNVQMLYGSIIHCLFQQVLKKQIQDESGILSEAELVIKQSKFVHDMYGIGVTEGEVLEEIKKYTPQIQQWIHQYTSGGQAVLGTHPKKPGEDVLITKIKDIEENIWSPRFGVKGKIDLTVEVRKKSRPGFGEKLTIPLELKTGRPSFSLEHKGQVTLYSMMSSDRRADPKQGLLLYLKEPSMKLIPADQVSQRGLIQLRNEMAFFLDQQVKRTTEDGNTVYSFGRLPDPINNSRTCPKCPHILHCAAFQKVEDRSLPSSHAMSILVPDTLAHLSPAHLDYFTRWCLMLDLESQANIRSGLRKIWCKTGPQRESVGECICRLNLLTDDNSSLIGQKSNADEEMCCITFTRNWSKNRGLSRDLVTVGLMSGDYVIVSSEDPSMIAVCMGTLQNLGAGSLELVTESESLPRLKEIRGATFRLDKYDGYSTSAILYTSLSRLMADNPRSARLRSLIIDRTKSEFLPKLSKSDIESVKKIFKPLNKPQKMSILKALMSKDYILIKGFPGTGKTSTIVALVKVCMVLGLSLLLTSYTHSAVDNILLKLKKDNVTFVRLGKSNKIHPDIRQFSADHLTKHLNTVGQLREFYHSQRIVATSCLGVNHPLFIQRRFDVCIVDEASQVLQSACLGPLFSADRFVLVGDPKQLPPVVQSQEARSIGMDESLFQHLDDNGATFDLNLQYRMNSAIMSISNTLVYRGALRCGSDMVANSELVIPDPVTLQQVIDKHGWLKQILLHDPDYKAAVFLNTSNIPAREARDHSGFITNVGEARIITILAEALIAGGVSAEDIGIIAPYRNQVNIIRDTLRNTNNQAPQGQIEVNTVDQYQGRDKEVILISFTRSFASSADQQAKESNTKANFRKKAKPFLLQDGTLFYQHKKHGALRVVKKDEVGAILKACHEDPFAGHQGVNRTWEKVKTRYFWPTLGKDVEQHVRECDRCQRQNHLAKTPSTLHPIPVKNKAFSMWGMDLVGPLRETSSGNRYIIVMTDYLTKWPEVKAIRTKTAEEIALFITETICRHGTPEVILTDNGREFCNQVNDNLCRQLKIDHRVTTPYHPQTNGLTERNNQTICSALTKYVNDNQDNWDSYIQQIAFAMRTCRQTSTKATPFFLTYGREATLPIQLDIPTSVNPSKGVSTMTEEEFQEVVDERVSSFVELMKVQQQATEHISQAQDKQKVYYDKKNEQTIMKPGDLVLLKNKKRINRKGDKMLTRWTGPHTIQENIGKGVYILVNKRQKVNIKDMKKYRLPSKATTEGKPRKAVKQSAKRKRQVSTLPSRKRMRKRKTNCPKPPKDIIATTKKENEDPETEMNIKDYILKLDNNTKEEIYKKCTNYKVGKPKDLQSVLESPTLSLVNEVDDRFGDDMMDCESGMISWYMTTKRKLELICELDPFVLSSAILTLAYHDTINPKDLLPTLDIVPLSKLTSTNSPSKLPKSSLQMRVGDVTMHRQDLTTIYQKHWLNDQVIHAYLSLLRSEYNTLNERGCHVLPCFLATKWESEHYDAWLYPQAGQLLKDVRRLNVAVTRAKHKLLLVGDRTSLQSYPPLVTIMDELMKKQCIVDLPVGADSGTSS